MPRLAAPLLIPILALALGCGGGGEEPADARAGGEPLTVYLSAPSRGDSALQADAVAAGARLALADARGLAGGQEVRLRELDSSAPEGSGWDPATVAANAERAADDPSAIAYVGELDLGGSAISLPITNRADLLQVSPLDGLTSLTRREPDGGRTGPERYYPSGRRSFVRLAPIDLIQAGALVEWARDSNARSLAAVSDQSLFGRELAAEATLVARCMGLDVTEPAELESGLGARDVTQRLAASSPDAVVFAGEAESGAASLFAAIDRKLPDAQVLAAGGVANLASGGRGFSAAPKLGAFRGATFTVKVALPPDRYPRRGRRVLGRLPTEGRGSGAGSEALYGYEAMRLVLDAVRDAGPEGGRTEVIGRAVAGSRRRESALGDFRIDAFGDTHQSRFGGYRTTASSNRFTTARRSRVDLAPPSSKGQGSPSACAELVPR